MTGKSAETWAIFTGMVKTVNVVHATGGDVLEVTMNTTDPTVVFRYTGLFLDAFRGVFEQANKLPQGITVYYSPGYTISHITFPVITGS